MAFQLNSKPLALDVPFKTSDGTQYPANWLRLSTADEKKAIGITEVADPASYDERFYTNATTPKSLTDTNVKDKEGKDLKDGNGDPVVAKGLKTIWVAAQKQQASVLLSKYDWYVVRKAEKTTAIPTAIKTYRDAIRTACKTREDEINACSDVAALKTLIDGTYDKDGKRTAGITEWPVDPNS
jgi:hypothetical protein